MPTAAGKQVGIAFKALKRCHSDVSKLLLDLDKEMKKDGLSRLWVGRDAVTYGVSKAIYAEHWMPERIYRYYTSPASDDAHNVVEGVNVCFSHVHPAASEPLLVIGKAIYRVPNGKKLIEVAQVWDFLDAFVTWHDTTLDDLAKVLRWRDQENGRVDEMRFIAVDLYSVNSMKVVLELLGQVRKAFAEG